MANMLDPGGGVGPPPDAPPAAPVSLTPILQQWLGPGPDAAARNAAAVAPAPVARPINDVAPPAYIPPRATGPIALPPPRPVNDVAPVDIGRYAPPSPMPPAFFSLDQQFAPLARAYQRGGPQDNAVGAQDVRNPAFDALQQSDAPPSSATLGIGAREAGLAARSIYKYDPLVSAGPPKGDTGWHPKPEVTVGRALDPLMHAINAGQSALDIISVHADKLIPGPGQGTIYDRFIQYTHQGMSPDQAANAAMRDYGDALQQLAEDPNAPGLARAGAQGARVIGAVQSALAPAPLPGGMSMPIAIGILGRGGEKTLAKLAEDAAKGLPMDAEMIAARIGAKTPAQKQFAEDLAREFQQRTASTPTKAVRTAAEDRLVELNKQGGTPLTELPTPTHGAGGNEPTFGMQLEKFPEEVQPFMKQIAARNADVLAQKTGPISHDELQVAAQMIGEPVSKVADRLAKRGINSAELEMVRQGVSAKIRQATVLAGAIARGEGSPSDALNALSVLQEAAAIQGRLHEASSEAGRMLNVLRKQIAPDLAANPTELAYHAAISRIARSPDHAQAIFNALLKVGDDPSKIYALLRTLNNPTLTDHLLSAWNLPRALRASFDLSAPLRQGAILSTAHPQRGAQAFKAMIDAVRDPAMAQAIDTSIRSSPMMDIRRKAGLFIADAGYGAPLSAREESFLTNLAGKLPGVAQSERAYTTYLNKLRTDVFDDAVLGLQRAGKSVSDEEAHAIAEWVNWASGRGSLGKITPAAPLLNGIFFSPRFRVSRFEAALAPAIFAVKGNREAAKMAAKDLVAWVGGNTSLITLSKLAGADIETDPRSPEFGKMKFGNTVVDPWGGEQQVVRNVAQFITGQKKTVTGKNRGQIVGVPRLETVLRYGESGLAPSTSLGVDLGKQVKKADTTAAAGKPPWDQPVGVDFIGQSFTPKDLVASTGSSLVLPMSWADIIDAINEDRRAGGSGLKGGLLGVGSFFGAGVTTYGAGESAAAPTTTSGNGWWK